MAFEIEFTESALRELESLRVFDHRRILTTIEEQLKSEPVTQTRNRKRLGEGLTANFEFVPPLWELGLTNFVFFMR